MISRRDCHFLGNWMNHFMEIAKMRAARYIWANLLTQFNPQNQKSLALRTHSANFWMEFNRARTVQ